MCAFSQRSSIQILGSIYICTLRPSPICSPSSPPLALFFFCGPISTAPFFPMQPLISTSSPNTHISSLTQVSHHYICISSLNAKDTKIHPPTPRHKCACIVPISYIYNNNKYKRVNLRFVVCPPTRSSSPPLPFQDTGGGWAGEPGCKLFPLQGTWDGKAKQRSRS